MPETKPYILYGRRKGKPLRAHKTALMEHLLPQLTVPFSESELDPAALFPGAEEFWLEVGFGTGEHLAAQAMANPQTGIIGAEPFLNGIAGLVGLVHQHNLKNVRIHPEDARPLLDRLKPGSLSRVFVLFADPWPKKRHAERRFIGPANLPKLARVLKPGAELCIASDDPTLQGWMEEHLAVSPDFAPMGPAFVSERPSGWFPTRYEEKSLAKHKPGWVGIRYYRYSRKK